MQIAEFLYDSVVFIYSDQEQCSIIPKNLNPDNCGEICPHGPDVSPRFDSYCEKGEKCCPKAEKFYVEECAANCGPYNPEGSQHTF